MTIYGIDTSHHQALGDFAAMKAGGVDFLLAKATEGVGWSDAAYADSRRGAKAAGILFGAYHFARPGDPVAQADYFLQVANPVAGELVVLDMEDTAIPAPHQWSQAWCARVKAKTGKPPLIYLNAWFLANYDWSAVVALDCGLWLAKYDGQPTGGPTGAWGAFSIKQFTDAGTVPGQPGQVDRNASPLTLDQLRAYAIGGETDMPSAEEVAAAVWGYKIGGGVTTKTGSPQPATLVLGELFSNSRDAGGALAKLLAAGQQQGITAADIAAAIPADIAQQVADALIARLKS